MAGNEAKTKQVIVVRSDLPMNAGKLSAQVSHATQATMLNKNSSKKRNQIIINLTEVEEEWFNDKFTKIVLEVKNETQLIKIKNKALEAGLNVVEIVDAGHTTFDKPTLTCIGIGPDLKENIDKVTRRLQMMKKTHREKNLEDYLIKKIQLLEDDKLTNLDEILEIRKILKS